MRTSRNRKERMRRRIEAVALIIILIALGAIAHAIAEASRKPKVEPVMVMQSFPLSNVTSIEEDPEPPEVPAFYYDVPMDHDLQDYIRDLCSEYDVPMDLIMAIIQCESGFQSNAVSATDDFGLMQINEINRDRVRSELGVTDLLNPEQNVLAGVYLFSEHYHSCSGDIEYALLRYNCGPTGAKKLWDKGIRSTYYTQKILKAYQAFKLESTPPTINENVYIR